MKFLPRLFGRGSEVRATARREDPALSNSMRQCGIAAVWRIRPIAPIWNMPRDAVRVKIRLRNDSFALAFVKFADRVEKWVVGPKGGSVGKRDWSAWELLILQSVNFRKVTA